MRAPAHPTSFLSPDSIVVLELSIGQSLVLSLCLDGGWLDLTASAQRGRSDDAPPHTHSASAQSQTGAPTCWLPPLRRWGGDHPPLTFPVRVGADSPRSWPPRCNPFSILFTPAEQHPQRKGYRACALTGYICKRII